MHGSDWQIHRDCKGRRVLRRAVRVRGMPGVGERSANEAKERIAKLIVLGVDPGTRVAGYGVVSMVDGKFEVIDMGVVKMNPKKSIGERLIVLREGLEEVFSKHDPDVVYVERVFVYKNSDSALKLKMSNSVAHELAAGHGRSCFEVSAKSAKKCATGDGSATKNTVRRAVQRICKLGSPPPADAADAVAIALCGASRAA